MKDEHQTARWNKYRVGFIKTKQMAIFLNTRPDFFWLIIWSHRSPFGPSPWHSNDKGVNYWLENLVLTANKINQYWWFQELWYQRGCCGHGATVNTLDEGEKGECWNIGHAVGTGRFYPHKCGISCCAAPCSPCTRANMRERTGGETMHQKAGATWIQASCG